MLMVVVIEVCCWALLVAGIWEVYIWQPVFALFLLGTGGLTMWKVAPKMYDDANARVT